MGEFTEEEILTLQAVAGGWDIMGTGYTEGRQSCLDKGLIETYTAFRLTEAGRVVIDATEVK